MHGLEPRCLEAQQTNWGRENSQARVAYVQRSQRQNKIHLSACTPAQKKTGMFFFFLQSGAMSPCNPPTSSPHPMSSSTVVTKYPESNVPPLPRTLGHASLRDGALYTCAQGSFPGVCTCTRTGARRRQTPAAPLI